MAYKRGPEVRYQADLPYPPIQVSSTNTMYARAMLDNMGGANSEMSAISLYFYNHLLIGDEAEIAMAFHRISIVEMHHMETFGELALQLGENPRLWTVRKNRKVYWSPAYNNYPIALDAMIMNSIKGENTAIEKYSSQMKWIQDENVKNNLQRIILDEQIHMEVLTELYRTYCK